MRELLIFLARHVVETIVLIIFGAVALTPTFDHRFKMRVCLLRFCAAQEVIAYLLASP